MNRETAPMRRIQIRMSSLGARVFRNNVGLFTTSRGERVKTGLCNGSSDLIGFTDCGRFLAIEVKTEDGEATPEQLDFIATVNRHGGIGFIAIDADDAEEKLRAAGGAKK